MKINLYKSWIDCTEYKDRPFKTVGRPFLMLDTAKHHPNKIIARMVSKHEGARPESGKLLVTVSDVDGYDNCLVGTLQLIHLFVRDCLVDEGYMSKIWGKQK